MNVTSKSTNRCMCDPREETVHLTKVGEDTTVSRHSDVKHILSGFRCTHFSCTVSQLCASERKLQLSLLRLVAENNFTHIHTYTHERCDLIYKRTNTNMRRYTRRESSSCSRLVAVDVTCHILTRWWRHLRLYVEMQSEDSHVRASRVRVVAIGWGREKVRKGGANEVRVSDDRL